MTTAPDFTWKAEPAPTGQDTVVLYTAVSMCEVHGNAEWLRAALHKRAEMGVQKYGDYLRINNGRRALVDYLQEQLDAIMYATQAYMEDRSAGCRDLLLLSIEAAEKAYVLIDGDSL